MQILAVIPARYASQRFPGKPLARIGDRPMVQWVYEAAKRCPTFDTVVVATDNEAIADCVRAFGGAVEMTRSNHATGTDRVAEVAQRYAEMQVIVNVQGDQPFVTPDMLTQLVAPYVAGQFRITAIPDQPPCSITSASMPFARTFWDTMPNCPLPLSSTVKG